MVDARELRISLTYQAEPRLCPVLQVNIFIFIMWKIVMPNRSNMRNRRVSSQLLAVNYASGDGALSNEESVDDEPSVSMRNDRLYVVSEPDIKTSSPARSGRGEEAHGVAEISNTVVDSDIRAAKWAWAVLAIAHCWLIYFMVYNLG
ncbi:hypothetical protein [Rhizobium rhizogenes]|uniref:hypothetical protein n=1 Tax=Rhizobium rhizogenes TaxID=359 RepID=UPI0022BD9B69|nr:hypothetical protein [Rhizobium rhizogenes]MCZ7487788.1 hypothetical protein [Rhizobium rhizogenes]